MIDQCVTYFKSKPVYEKVFAGFREKYESLGHFGGRVVLKDPTEREREDLTGFLHKDFKGKKNITITANMMEKALADSKFSGLSYVDILEAYLGEKLQVKKDVREAFLKQKELWFSELLVKQKVKPAVKAWFEALLSDHLEGYQLIIQRYNEESKRDTSCKALAGLLRTIFTACDRLPLSEKMLLNVFAAEVSANPHFFDSGSDAEKLLLSYLRFGKESFLEEETDKLAELERKSILLYEAGLLKDALSNDVLLYGITGELKAGGIHIGMAGFAVVCEPLKLTMESIGRLKAAYPQPGGDKSVYVVENPSVFSYLCGKKKDISLICSNGQIRLATLLLMDLFSEDVCFYYAGDFDPEGLLIAERLKKRYGSRVKLWHYDKELYLSNMADMELSDSRLKILEQVTDEGLMPIKELLYEHRRTAYQESFMQVFLKF